MALAWIQWNDTRRPPPTPTSPSPPTVPLDIIDSHEATPEIHVPSYDDQPSSEQELEVKRPSHLTRLSSVGGSWGVTAVGRGFGWSPVWNSKEAESEPEEFLPVVSIGAEPSVPEPERDDERKGVIVKDTPDHQSQTQEQQLQERDPVQEPPLEPEHSSSPIPLRTPELLPSPASPTFAPELSAPIPRTSGGRPCIAGRSQSMYILTSLPPSAQPSAPASPNLAVQDDDRRRRARAWSRPVSPVRSFTSLPNQLPTSPSAPSLSLPSKGVPRLDFSGMTPLTITAGAMTTPNTPRSPRLNRSRASQKRVSLIAGRQVAGLSMLDAEGVELLSRFASKSDFGDDDDDRLMMFRSRPRQVESPEPDVDRERLVFSENDSGSRPGSRSGSRRGSDYEGLSRSPSKSYHNRSRPATPPPEVDYHIGRAGLIKSLGGFNSSLINGEGVAPPTPLRCASFPNAAGESPLSPLSLPPGSPSHPEGIPEDVRIPVEEAAPIPAVVSYPNLDIPHPDWSLQRLSSSWSLSSSSHNHTHTLSTATSARSPSVEKGDEITMAMRRMKSSHSIKRGSSESGSVGRRGGFLGGRTIEDYVIQGEAGRGAYGLVKRARERKKPTLGMGENGDEVILENVEEDETVGPPLIIKLIIKSRILADCWKKHPLHGTIPIEIYVMSALSGTSYVLPKPRAWDPRRFEETSNSETSRTVTPGNQTPGKEEHLNLKIQITSIDGEEKREGGDEVTDLDMWRWREGELIKGHPNICPLEDFFEDAGFYYLVLPATKPSFPTMPPGMEDTVEIGDRSPPSDLFDLVELYPSGLPGPLVRSYLGQIADALSFLHARGICHRDIKDENVVLGEHGRCWLIDFGSSGVIRRGGWDTFSGTLDYAAPEILHGDRYAGPPQDVWAYGIVAYVLLVGECPFGSSAESALGLEDPEGKPALALRARCSAGPAGFDEGMERDGGGRLGDAMELVRRCLSLEVEGRPTMEEILSCRYLNGGSGWGQDSELVGKVRDEGES